MPEVPAHRAADEVHRLLYAPVLTQALAAVAELGVPDLVAEGPRTVSELAGLTGTDAAALHRVLRALASHGVFREVGTGTFAGTPMADTLRADAPDSLRDWARLWGVPERTAALGDLLRTVRTGEPAFPRLFGTDWWSHLADHPDHAAVFNGAMSDLSRQVHTRALEGYDLSAARRLVDVGGGEGELVALLLRRYPDLTAVVHERPGVARRAAARLDASEVRDRVTVESGDFFAAVPSGGDVYLLSMILHDWDDARCVRVLRHIRRAMRPDGRVLVIDAVVPEGDGAHEGKLRDLVMLTLHPGRERTAREFTQLLARSGLRHSETRSVAGATALVVGRPEPGPEEPAA